MKAQLISFADLPLELIEQKEQLVPTAIPVLENHPDVFAIEILQDDGTRIGASWFVRDRIYNQLVGDTLIIDKQYRSLKTFKEAYKLMHDIGVQIASTLSLPRIVVGSKSRRFVEQACPNAKLRSYIFYEEV